MGEIADPKKVLNSKPQKSQGAQQGNEECGNCLCLYRVIDSPKRGLAIHATTEPTCCFGQKCSENKELTDV